MSKSAFFIFGCLVEGGVGLIGCLLAWFLGVAWHDYFAWSGRDALIGLCAAIPVFCGFLWSFHSDFKPLVEIRHFLDSVVRPFMGHWSLGQFAVIACLAGTCEEALFRWGLQAGLAPWLGTWPALFFSSLLFGLLHGKTWLYAWLASGISLYLGLLFIYTNNLLVPMLAHGLYDFAALLYLYKFRAQSDPA